MDMNTKLSDHATRVDASDYQGLPRLRRVARQTIRATISRIGHVV